MVMPDVWDHSTGSHMQALLVSCRFLAKARGVLIIVRMLGQE